MPSSALEAASEVRRSWSSGSSRISSIRRAEAAPLLIRINTLAMPKVAVWIRVK